MSFTLTIAERFASSVDVIALDGTVSAFSSISNPAFVAGDIDSGKSTAVGATDCSRHECRGEARKDMNRPTKNRLALKPETASRIRKSQCPNDRGGRHSLVRLAMKDESLFPAQALLLSTDSVRSGGLQPTIGRIRELLKSALMIVALGGDRGTRTTGTV